MAFKFKTIPQWEIMEPGRLRAGETRVVIDYVDGWFHIHRLDKDLDQVLTCNLRPQPLLGMAKQCALLLIHDLLEMGMDP